MFIESVQTSNYKDIDIYIADGKVILILTYATGEVERRHLDKSQVDALIEALQKAKEALE